MKDSAESQNVCGDADPYRNSERQLQRDVRLGFLLHDVSRMRRNAFRRMMRGTGVAPAQWGVLAHLALRDGMTQAQLAGLLEMGPSGLGSTLKCLEQKGLIERRDDPVDLRAKRVYLTSLASTFVKRMEELELFLNRTIFKDLDHEETGRAIRSLDTLRKTLLGHVGKIS